MKCRKCGVEKPLMDFYQNYRIEGGYNPICKKCIVNQQNEYRKRKEAEKPKIVIEETDWSDTAIMCHYRNCSCSGCFFENFFSDKTQKCQMKFAVIELVKEFGVPKGAEDERGNYTERVCFVGKATLSKQNLV